MAYFRWKGVDITGKWHTGRLSALSYEQLDQLLFKRGIALISAKPTICLSRGRVSLSLFIQFFHHLTTLLEAGVRLPQALDIVAAQITHPRLQETLLSIAQQVHHGNSLAGALQKLDIHLPRLIYHMLSVGEEAGKLSRSCKLIEEYLQMQHTFYRKLRALLYMPLITFAFVMVIMVIMFGYMIPHFITLIPAGTPLPFLTQVAVTISNKVQTIPLLAVGVAIVLCLLIWYRWKKTERGKYIQEKCIAHLPLIGTLYKRYWVMQWSAALALLLESGLSLAVAIAQLQTTMQHSYFGGVLQDVSHQIKSGSNLQSALVHHTSLFSSEAIAMIAIGEESNTLALMFTMLSRIEYDRLQAQLNKVIICIQPFLLLFLGILVALLIMAVYVPIISVAFNIPQ